MSNKNFTVTYVDDTTVEVRPLLVDTLAFESTLRKNKSWGDLKDNALKITAFRAWSALHREGRTALTWDEWSATVVAVESVDTDDTDADDLAGTVGKGGSSDHTMSS